MSIALRRTAVAAVLLYASLLAGCGGRAAMTTDEFRAKEAGNVEIIEVDRPLRDVVATFRDRRQPASRTYKPPASTAPLTAG
jgi:hypothetical protein